MSGFVVDASVSAAWFLPDEATEFTEAALAARCQLSTYDAAYLELALRRQLPLATRDTALLAAMQQIGVDPADPTG